jgi:hypothetical protein
MAAKQGQLLPSQPEIWDNSRFGSAAYDAQAVM